MKARVSKREINRQRWRERIDTWEESNLSQKAYCEVHHLSFGSFRRWRRLFKAEAAQAGVTPSEPVHFLPVKVTEPACTNLTLHFQDDLRIEVATGFNTQLLRQVIQVLRSS